MVLANKITMVRIVITPLFFVLFQVVAYEDKQAIYWLPGYLQVGILLVLVLLFVGAELSDLLDGIVARRMALVSGAGKLFDPFADVLSRLTYFFCFYQVGLMPAYALILILWRELGMLFVRQLVQLSGRGPLPARWAGKVKAVIYLVTTILALLLFVVANWPGLQNGFAESMNVCPFTVASRNYESPALVLYIIVRSWLLPIGFIVSVLVSWYSFALYLRTFWPALKGLL